MAGGRFSNLEFEGSQNQSQQPERLEERKGLAAQAARKRNERKKQLFVSEDRNDEFYLKEADKAMHKGDHEGALRNFSAALNENSLCLEAWLGQLVALNYLEEYPEVKTWAGKALEKFPDNPRLLAAKAIAMYRMGMLNEARDLCDSAIGMAGEHAVVWLCRGEVMLKVNGKTAAECFNHALRKDKDNALLPFEVGFIYCREKKYHQALEILQNACMKSPKSAWGWYLMGTTQFELGMLSQAKSSFERASTIAPKVKIYKKALERNFGSSMAKLKSLFKRMTR